MSATNPHGRGFDVVDLHNDLITAVQHQWEREDRAGFAGFWLPQLRAGGVTVQVLPFFTSEQFVGEGALRRCLGALDLARSLAAAHPDDVLVIDAGADLERARSGGRVALVLALEGLEPVGADLAVLRTLHRLGVRMASLTWNRRTMFADGQEQVTAAGRLTDLGVAAVAQMETLGMALDVSHLSDAGFWHVEEVAHRPYLASHSNCRALVDHPRNLTDAQLRALGGRRGVVGINLWGRFLGLRAGDAPEERLDRALDHVVHALEVAGEDCVALGPDFMWDYTRTTDPVLGVSATDDLEVFAPPGLRRPDDLPALLERLAARVGEPVTRKIAGGNALRLLADLLPGEGPP